MWGDNQWRCKTQGREEEEDLVTGGWLVSGRLTGGRKKRI